VAKRDVEGLENYQDDLKELGAGAVMVHYVVLPQKVRIVLTTPDIQIGRSAAIDEAALNREVLRFREALGNPGSDPLPLARSLYRVLLAPIAEDLRQAKAQTLMLSLDGVLRYLPMAALHDGERYAAERWRMSVMIEAARTRFSARGGDAVQFAGLGVTREIPGFDPLPAVKQELEAIVKAVPGELHFDNDFTAQTLRGALAKRANMLHLATHFVFTPGTETDSFLLLGDGGRLSLREIREAGFNFRGVDLLTLSACETAVGGGADANGREVEGLGALVQQRGARAVMATLWPVADESTGLLMQRFYQLRVGSRLSKAQALQQAQLELLHGKYAHPFFWAPFILMGNWL
jgi:CHAT domain-containing protein